jgi:hypothetical protein
LLEWQIRRDDQTCPLIRRADHIGNRRLELGSTLASFMRELDLDPGRGGVRSDAHRLREQIQRLFRSTISFEQS